MAIDDSEVSAKAAPRMDRWLLIIVAAIVLIVVVALVVVLTRPAVEYLPEGTPEATVHNYLLALQKEDFERAHSYLSPTLPGYPGVDEFEDQLQERWRYRNVNGAAFSTEDSRTLSNGDVRITVREVRYESNGPFESSQSTYEFDMRLQQEAGDWRLTDGDEYWHRCWDRDDCP